MAHYIRETRDDTAPMRTRAVIQISARYLVLDGPNLRLPTPILYIGTYIASIVGVAASSNPLGHYRYLCFHLVQA